MLGTNALQKYVPPVITPAVGGVSTFATTNGLPGYQPTRVSGFYPTAAYAAVRTFTDAAGVVNLQPASYVDYRLRYDLLTQTPPLSTTVMGKLVDDYFHDRFDPTVPYVFVSCMMNIWTPGQTLAPVIPAPEVYLQYLPSRWYDGAVTTAAFKDGAFSFIVDAGAYAVVGVAAPGAQFADPSSVDFGFFFAETSPVKIIESGVQTTLGTSYYATPTNTFTVRVVGSTVSYLINGTVVRQTTLTPTRLPVVWSGIACLYGANSVVSVLSVTQYSGAAVALPALRKYVRGANLSLKAPTGTAGWKPYARNSLKALTGVGGTAPYTRAAMSLPALTGGGKQFIGFALRALTSSAGNGNVGKLSFPKAALRAGAKRSGGNLVGPLAQAFGMAGRIVPLGGMGVLPRIRAIGVGGMSSGGGLTAKLPALIGRSARYASMNGVLKSLALYAQTDPAHTAFLSGPGFATPTLEPQMFIAVTMDSAGAITSVGVVNSLIEDVLASSIVAGDAYLASLVLQALLNSTIFGTTVEPFDDISGVGQAWVVNADTGATSTYENYGFNSYGSPYGVPFAARRDGLYRLDSDSDAGSPIHAYANFGETDFGTAQLKRMEYVMLGVASSGTMYIKVKVRGGEEYIYKARRSDDYMAQQRVDVGRGIRASYMGFELFNSNGADFELNTVSFVAAELTRKV
jgi:hypothetical protein